MFHNWNSIEEKNIISLVLSRSLLKMGIKSSKSLGINARAENRPAHFNFHLEGEVGEMNIFNCPYFNPSKKVQFPGTEKPL